MTISSSTRCNPNVDIRAQMSKMPGVTHLEFTYSHSRYEPGFTVVIKSPWLTMTLLSDEVEKAVNGIKSGGLKLLSTELADEFMPLICKGVAKMNKMMEAAKS